MKSLSAEAIGVEFSFFSSNLTLINSFFRLVLEASSNCRFLKFVAPSSENRCYTAMRERKKKKIHRDRTNAFAAERRMKEEGIFGVEDRIEKTSLAVQGGGALL
jgi:hypothetical protein